MRRASLQNPRAGLYVCAMVSGAEERGAASSGGEAWGGWKPPSEEWKVAMLATSTGGSHPRFVVSAPVRS